MDRFRFDDQKIKPDPFIAYAIGAVAAYVLWRYVLNLNPQRVSGFFVTPVVVAAGGLWYHWRKLL